MTHLQDEVFLQPHSQAVDLNSIYKIITVKPS